MTNNLNTRCGKNDVMVNLTELLKQKIAEASIDFPWDNHRQIGREWALEALNQMLGSAQTGMCDDLGGTDLRPGTPEVRS